LEKNNFIVVQPRFADFNLQGILRAALYLDFVCECQLHQFEHRFGIKQETYTARGERWHITEYFIRVKKPVRAIEQFIVEADIIGVLESRLRVRFRFLSHNRRTIIADGYICFDVVDDKTNAPRPIPQNERDRLSQFVDESET
jgi:acyl-CoA thioesterase FadM